MTSKEEIAERLTFDRCIREARFEREMPLYFCRHIGKCSKTGQRLPSTRNVAKAGYNATSATSCFNA
jgi:hypothetical protein